MRRAEDEEVLVTLDFSDQAKQFLQGQHIEVAKAMFNTGVLVAGRMAGGEIEELLDEDDELDYESRVLH